MKGYAIGAAIGAIAIVMAIRYDVAGARGLVGAWADACGPQGR